MATPPQGAGNSNDLRTPVNATQGARDFLVNDDYQFNFDDFLGPRPSGSTNSDAAQQHTRSHTVDRRPRRQPAYRRARSRPRKLRLFRTMRFDQVAAGYASGPGHILAQEFKQWYMRF
ncbi:hypothetical protein E4U27_004216 [Claviceps purpurea]|nr:hypothetical protein E4U27_004216 [Claviceps purpurea]